MSLLCRTYLTGKVLTDGLRQFKCTGNNSRWYVKQAHNGGRDFFAHQMRNCAEVLFLHSHFDVYGYVLFTHVTIYIGSYATHVLSGWFFAPSPPPATFYSRSLLHTDWMKFPFNPQGMNRRSNKLHMRSLSLLISIFLPSNIVLSLPFSFFLLSSAFLPPPTVPFYSTLSLALFPLGSSFFDLNDSKFLHLFLGHFVVSVT